MFRYPLISLAVLVLVVGKAQAAPECHATVLRTVTDDLGNVWRAGQTLPVDIARTDADGRAFCATRGSCIPRTINGASALRLTNCRIGPSLGHGDYRLVPDGQRSLQRPGPAR